MGVNSSRLRHQVSGVAPGRQWVWRTAGCAGQSCPSRIRCACCCPQCLQRWALPPYAEETSRCGTDRTWASEWLPCMLCTALLWVVRLPSCCNILRVAPSHAAQARDTQCSAPAECAMGPSRCGTGMHAELDGGATHMPSPNKALWVELPPISRSAYQAAHGHCEQHPLGPTWLSCALQYICQAPRLASNWTKSQVPRSVRALAFSAEQAGSS